MTSVGRGAAAWVVLATIAAPSQAAPRQPTGPWHVQFDGVQCVAVRDYGTDAKPVTLALKPSPSGGVMRVIVSSKGFADFGQWGETIRFDDDKIDTNALYYEDETKTRRLVAINVPMAQFKAHLQTRTIGLEGAPFTGAFTVPDLQGVVLHPSRPGKHLGVLAICGGHCATGRVEEEAARAGRPLVDRGEEGHRGQRYQ